MRHHAAVAGLVLLVLVGVVVPSGAVLAGAASGTVANVAITDVTVTPSSPVPGETVTLTATIENFESSDQTFVVDAVALRTGPGSDFGELARTRGPGRIAPGASLDVPLTRSFATPGEKQLRVVVSGRVRGGERLQLSYLVTVRVTDAEPRVTVDLQRPIEGVESNATVTVANGLERDLRNVQVTLSGDVDVDRPRRIRSTLAGGETGTFAFEASPIDAGETDLTATVEYTLANGPTRTVATTTTVRTAELDDRVALTTNATGRGVSVTATNLGNVDAENLVIGGEATNATVGQVVVGTLRPDESTTVRLPVRDVVGRTTVAVRADYEVDDEPVTVPGDAVTLRSTPGRVVLTGIDVRSEPDHLLVTGSASNVGLTAVDSVVVEVRETDGVTPVAPNREYFVGSIPASDFVSFDVTARVEPGVTAIPLEVTYLSEGERRVERVSVPLGGVAAGTPAGSGSDSVLGGPIVLAAVGAVVAIAVGVLVFVGWRNRRAGD